MGFLVIQARVTEIQPRILTTLSIIFATLVVCIIAVHGLGAHPEFTWTAKRGENQPPVVSGDTTQPAGGEDRVNWLKDEGFLKQDFKTARVMTFGYNADWFLAAPMATAEQRAVTLLRELKRKREGLEAISEAKDDRGFEDIYDATCGIIFLGTPHQGSDASAPAVLLAVVTTPVFGSKAILPRLLQTRDSLLFGFLSLGLIVDRDSATLDIAKSIEINTDHSGLNKCTSRKNRLYLELCTVISEVLEKSRTDSYLTNRKTREIMTRIGQVDLYDIRRQDCSIVNQANQQNWYQMTEGYKNWKRSHASEFLWFRGRAGTAKTPEINNILRIFDETENEVVDTIAYFCPRMSLRSKMILRSIVIQLGRSSQSRVSLLGPTQKGDLLSLIEPETSMRVEVLWDLFQSLLDVSDRNLCLILDGIDALPLEDLGGFAKTLHRIWDITRSKFASRPDRKIWFKVLITSRPNLELLEILGEGMFIDPDIERLECLHSLAVGAENPRQNDENISRPVRGSGDWIFTDPRYTSWASSDYSDILWLFGKPGSGKSTLLLKLLRESLRSTNLRSLRRMLIDCTGNEMPMSSEQPQNQSVSTSLGESDDASIQHKVVVSYFYNFRNKKEIDDERMLQSILFQILTQEPRLFLLFRTKYLQLRKLGSKGSNLWTYGDMIVIFQNIINFKGFRLRIELFLDAVDESKHSSRIMNMLYQKLTDCTRSDIIFKLIVARRPMESFHELPSDRKIYLEAHNSEDIDKLINEGVEKIERTLENFSDRVDFVRQSFLDFQKSLRKRANGVILWVSIALVAVQNDCARGGFKITGMMHTLDALPSDLEELYIHIIKQLRMQKQDEVENVKHKLHWATHSGRTLTVNEFFHAIAISEILCATFVQPLRLEDMLIPHSKLEGVRTTLSSSCGGFLEVQSPQQGNGLYDPESFIVQLIHRSVRTFLEKEEAGPFRAVKHECNLKIAQACIHYLRISLGSRGNITDIAAFVNHLGHQSLLTYIWAELPAQLLELDQRDLLYILQDLTSFLQELCKIDLRHSGLLILHTWILQLLTQIPSRQNEIEQWKSNTRSKLTEATTYKTDLQSFLRDVLVAAVEAKNFATLKITLEAGALSCDKEDQVLSAALEAMVKMNSSTALELISKHHVSIDPTSSIVLSNTLGKALETACRNGYAEVTRWLLERRAASGTADQGYTAIYQAVSGGHSVVVKLLLDHGVSPECNGENVHSLLLVASEKGHASTVDALLQFGQDPNIADSQHMTALAAAAEAGHEEVVKLLLSRTTNHKGSSTMLPTKLNPPSRFLVPKERNNEFVGRAEILHSLEEALRSEVTRIAVVGLGGIGKTATITEFAYRVFEKDIASSIFWIDASSDVSFVRDHEYTSRRLQWHLAQSESPESLLTQFYNRLSLEPGTKVVIWDNVDHPDDLIHFTEALTSTQSLCIIITSRNASFSRDFAKDTAGLIELSGLSMLESVKLLRGVVESGDEDTLQEVSYRLEGIPLAIVQAVSYMRRQRLSPQKYKSLLDEAEDRNKNHDGVLEFANNTTIFQTLEISLNSLEKKDMLAVKILSFVSNLDASHIPIFLLVHLSSDSVPHISMDNLDESIGSLQNYSLVNLTQDEGFLDMHRVVQRFMRERLYKKGNITQWENAALRAISDEFPLGDFEDWEKCGELLPHALVVLECDSAKDDKNYSYRQKLLKRAGIYLMETGRYVVSEKLLEEGYIISMKHYGPVSSESQSVSSLLARLFLRMGKLKDAEGLELQVIESTTKTLGLEHPDTLASSANLASIYRNQGRWREAEKLEVHVLEIRRKLLGEEHPDTLTSMVNLASTYRNQGRWNEAEKLELQVVESSKKVLGLEHPDTLRSMSNLALTFWYQGRWNDAEKLELQVLESSKKVLGLEHPDTLTSMSNLATTYGSQGRSEEAEVLEAQVLETRKRVLGLEHPDTLTSMSNLSLLLSNQGRIKEAENIGVQVLEMRKRILGDKHPGTLTSMANLADIQTRRS
ncbi:hypothetical protein BP5796_12267 [Coleophoma crateriformis]|uniref:AAA+ ATPase domain-containing protein n=1 Tax=Coleophoma crateriformis TaxID=565419 RepID=A0A3D8Q9K1_9HELO|nr:hypothetical protein BP5796_12267 [Coleophoma crateriformis]